MKKKHKLMSHTSGSIQEWFPSTQVTLLENGTYPFKNHLYYTITCHVKRLWKRPNDPGGSPSSWSSVSKVQNNNTAQCLLFNSFLLPHHVGCHSYPWYSCLWQSHLSSCWLPVPCSRQGLLLYVAGHITSWFALCSKNKSQYLAFPENGLEKELQCSR